MANAMEPPSLNEISADTRKEFAMEVAGRVQRKLERKSRKEEWGNRLEAAAMQAQEQDERPKEGGSDRKKSSKHKKEKRDKKPKSKGHKKSKKRKRHRKSEDGASSDVDAPESDQKRSRKGKQPPSSTKISGSLAANHAGARSSR